MLSLLHREEGTCTLMESQVTSIESGGSRGQREVTWQGSYLEAL